MVRAGRELAEDADVAGAADGREGERQRSVGTESKGVASGVDGRFEAIAQVGDARGRRSVEVVLDRGPAIWRGRDDQQRLHFGHTPGIVPCGARSRDAKAWTGE